MIIGNKEFNFDREAHIMGILNVTPDSFSDGGKYTLVDNALSRVEAMIKEGATIIDVGGESTRPGYEKISDEEEIERVATVIWGIRERFDVAISLDTYKSKVAKAGIEAGAHMINDIWGLKADVEMADVIAKAGVACCIMHNKTESVYDNYVQEVLEDLKESVDMAIASGISKKKIMLDPGVGFGKTYHQNLEIINKCDEILKLGYPVLLGTSRKSVIGLTLDLPVELRLNGTIATTVVGYMKGCRIFRVHDVKANYEALKMTEAILKSNM